MRTRFIMPLTLAAAIAALAAACGGAATPTPMPTAPATPTPTSTQAQPPAQAGAVAADIRNFKHETLTVQVGETVTWTNRDGPPHTSTSGEPGALTGLWDSDSLRTDKSFSFTFAEAGSFPYFCSIHPSMRGVVNVVTAASDAPAGGTSADQGDTFSPDDY